MDPIEHSGKEVGGEVTRLMHRAGEGDAQAAEELLPLVYDELRRVAAAQLGREAPGQTLQPTALVHEAYLRLLGPTPVNWQGKAHFFNAAARAMRRILVDRARRNAAEKHGGGRRSSDLGEVAEIVADDGAEPGAGTDFPRLDVALDRLEALDKRRAEIVMLRYFAGLTVEQTALAMDLSATTIKNEWMFARAWLRREMDQLEGGA